MFGRAARPPYLLALVALALAAGVAFAQPVLPLPRWLEDDKRPVPEKLDAPAKETERPAPEKLDAPRNEKDDKANDKKPPRDQRIYPQSYPGGLYPAIPVTLPDVLKLATLANLDIAQANLAVERARVAVLRANSQYLPNLSAGVVHQAHDGTIQRTEGTVVEANRDSLFVGGGPTLSFPVSEALFGPPQARHLLEAARFGQGRVTLATLVQVADAYFAVLRARRQLARFDEVLDMLTSEREDELRGKSKGLLPIITAFVKAGTALPSDQARVEADVVRRQGERVRALEDVRTASAELSRLLHLNAGYFLLPVEDYRYPLVLPCQKWFSSPVEELIPQALSRRPELAENQAFLEAAILRYKEAKWRPLLPTFQAGLSWGGFGGGPQAFRNARGQTFLGHSGNINNFDVRTDLDLSVVWRLEGLGLGNLARIRDSRLQTEQVENQRLFLQDQVVAQVVQSMESVQRGEQRYRIYRAGLFDESGKPVGTVYRSLRLNFLRIKGGQGTPLEVLDSTRRHSDVLQGYADAITDYDRARLRLLLALGLSPDEIIDCAGNEIVPPPPAKEAAKPGEKKDDFLGMPRLLDTLGTLSDGGKVIHTQPVIPGPTLPAEVSIQQSGGVTLPAIGQADGGRSSGVTTQLPPPRYSGQPLR